MASKRPHAHSPLLLGQLFRLVLYGSDCQELMRQAWNGCREAAFQSGGANREAGGPAADDGMDAFGAVDRACDDDGLGDSVADRPDEICDIDIGAIGKEIEAVDAFAGGKVFCACNDLRHGTLQNAGMARNAAGEGVVADTTSLKEGQDVVEMGAAKQIVDAEREGSAHRRDFAGAVE